MKSNIYASFMLALMLCTGCSLAPHYVKPEVELPAEPVQTGESSPMITTEWWNQYGDGNLDQLVTEALRNNDDLRLAAARLEEARAILGFAGADRFPLVNANAAALRQKGLSSVSSIGAGGVTGVTYNFFNLSAAVSYELDLWGKIKNRQQAALSAFLATGAARDALQLSLTSDVATIYFNLVSLGRQIRTTENILARYKDIYEFRQKQYTYGVLDEIVVQQAKAQVEAARVLLESLKEQDNILKNTLSLVLGRTPREIFASMLSIEEKLPEPLVIPPLLPSRLLENRPDIMEAEEALKAASFQIGVAKAAYFPSISLTGGLGLQSVELSDLMESSSTAWNLGGSLTAPIFDFGRIKANVEITEARQKSALLQYIKTVKTAFKEVQDSLIRIAASRNKYQAQQDELKALEKVLSLATKKYEAGATDYLTVLDAQRGYLNSVLNVTSLQAELINNQVALYKALGGGWDRKTLLTEKSAP